MTCAACQQNRMPCATPWTCGGHDAQANYERVMSLPIQFVGKEPPEPPEPPAPKPEPAIGWRHIGPALGGMALLAVLVIWLCHL